LFRLKANPDHSSRKKRLPLFVCTIGSWFLYPLHADPMGPGPVFPVPKKAAMALVLSVQVPEDVRSARVLVKSLRTFGGEFATIPVYLFVHDPEKSYADRVKIEGVTTIPLNLEPDAAAYPFARKVYACAQAERILAGCVKTIVYLDNECLVLSPPREWTLAPGKEVALCPVFLVNRIGIPPGHPLDPFWETIYRETGTDPATIPTIHTLVDQSPIRFYINCQIVPVRPELGIFREWERVFTRLLRNGEFQIQSCADPLHQIFLHQAVLSAVIGAKIPQMKIHWFSPGNSYPLPQHQKLPVTRKLARMNDVVTMLLDTLPTQRPDWIDTMPCDEPLRSWIVAAYGR